MSGYRDIDELIGEIANDETLIDLMIHSEDDVDDIRNIVDYIIMRYEEEKNLDSLDNRGLL